MNTNSPIILFFDIGGVLLSNGWGHESRQKAAEHFGYDHHSVEPLHNFIFNIYEIGRISLDEYLDRTVFSKPRDFSKQDFKTFMFDQSEELPGFLPWLKNWKKENQAFHIIAINNEGKELNEHRIQKFGLHECFDAFASSCIVGMRKPDPEIFKLAMGLAQTEPQNCYYFDDRPMIVHAAKKLGMNAHHHREFSETKKIIEEIINPH